MQQTPQVSIGMPVYNGEAYLEQALDSILAQTYRDFELIISDNASTDRTQAICERYVARDERVRYTRNPQNLGAAPNYNRLVALARGRYFKWAAHDDLLAPTYLERLAPVLDADPGVVLAYPRTTIIDAQGAVVRQLDDGFHLAQARSSERFRAFLRLARGWMNPVFGLIRAAVLRQTPLIGSYPSSDMILVGELALRGRFHEVPEPLFLRRDHPQMSVAANKSFRERNRWFNSAYRGKVDLTHWRWLSAYLGAMNRVPLGPVERTRCQVLMLGWSKRRRRELLSDLVGAAAAMMRPQGRA